MRLSRAHAMILAPHRPEVAAALALSDAEFIEFKPRSDYVPRNHHPRLGTRLASLFAFLGFKRTAKCGCAQREAWLNRHGLKLELAGWLIVLSLVIIRLLS